MITRTELLTSLQLHFENAQPSERWATYRLISPVVDYANQCTGWEVYFELNQTSEHRTSQSADIALRDSDGKTQVIVEAKRVWRTLTSGQVQKYLQPDQRGIVTDGARWILCVRNQHERVELWSKAAGHISPEALERVAAFIRGEIEPDESWPTEGAVWKPLIRPVALKKASVALRRKHEVHEARNLPELHTHLASLGTRSAMDTHFLDSLLAKWATHGGLPSGLRCEVRDTRVSFFDEAAAGQRVARIEIGLRQADVLVLTEIVRAATTLNEICKSNEHDKGKHMRRFRLHHSEQATQFGAALADALYHRALR